MTISIVARNAVVINNLTKTTRSEYAAMTGLSKSTIRRLHRARKEKREYNPTVRTLSKLAAFAGVTLDEFATKRLAVQ